MRSLLAHFLKSWGKKRPGLLKWQRLLPPERTAPAYAIRLGAPKACDSRRSLEVFATDAQH